MLDLGLGDQIEQCRLDRCRTYTKAGLSPNASTRHYTYAPGTHRLANIRIGSATGTVESSFTHDFEGRLTAQSGVGAKTLTWDAKGRLRSVGGETYAYDPMDYRIGRSGGSMGNRSYFLEGEHLESEYSGSNLQAKYFRGVSTDELVAAWVVDSDLAFKPFLFHHDQVTSTTAVSGHNGGITQSVKYAAFGAVQSNTGSSPNRLKYTGMASLSHRNSDRPAESSVRCRRYRSARVPDRRRRAAATSSPWRRTHRPRGPQSAPARSARSRSAHTAARRRRCHR
jgi:hypothetical protein